jgi:hypothetical protein
MHDLAWLRRQLREGERVWIGDRSGVSFCLGLWGPRARDVLERLTDDDLKELRAPYDALEFTPGLPSFSDPVLRQLAWRHALNACEAFPGMLELLRRLDEEGRTLGIVSAKRHDIVQLALDALGFGDTLDIGKLDLALLAVESTNSEGDALPQPLPPGLPIIIPVLSPLRWP